MLDILNAIIANKVSGGSGSSGGGLPSVSEPHQMLVTDADGKTVWTERPFYKTGKWERNANAMFGQGVVTEAFTVTTAYNEEFGCAIGNHDFLVVPPAGYACRVVFDGDTHEMEAKESAGSDYLGADPGSDILDFSKYPFCILNGKIITKDAGDHTIDLFLHTETIEANYLTSVYIQSDTDSDGNPFFSMEDVARIEDAYRSGIPVALGVGIGSAVVKMVVDVVDSTFICAHAVETGSRGCVQTYAVKFLVSDGTLYTERRSVVGTIDENGDDYPIMYIANKCYKITVGSDGALKATEYTG